MTFELEKLSLKFLHCENIHVYHPVITMWKHLFSFMNIYNILVYVKVFITVVVILGDFFFFFYSMVYSPESVF